MIMENGSGAPPPSCIIFGILKDTYMEVSKKLAKSRLNSTDYHHMPNAVMEKCDWALHVTYMYDYKFHITIWNLGLCIDRVYSDALVTWID